MNLCHGDTMLLLGHYACIQQLSCISYLRESSIYLHVTMKTSFCDKLPVTVRHMYAAAIAPDRGCNPYCSS